jgi:hypothetical protein
MKETLDKILETVTVIKENQAATEVHLENIKSDVQENKDRSSKNEKDITKFKGAGILGGIMATTAGIYRGFFS